MQRLHIKNARDLLQLEEGITSVSVNGQQNMSSADVTGVLLALPKFTELQELELWYLARFDVTDQLAALLPALSEQLRSLVIGNCGLRNPSMLPRGLVAFTSNSNPVSSLPDLPPNLVELVCTGNICDVKRLPLLPASVQDINISFDVDDFSYYSYSWPHLRQSMTASAVSALVPSVPDQAADLLKEDYFDSETKQRVVRALLSVPNALVRWHWLSGFLGILSEEEAHEAEALLREGGLRDADSALALL